MRVTTAAGFVCVLVSGVALSAESQPVPAAACEQLARSLSFPKTTVTLAQAVEAGKFMPPGGGAAATKAAASLPGLLPRHAEDCAVSRLRHQIRGLAARLWLEREVPAGRQRGVGRIDSIRRPRRRASSRICRRLDRYRPHGDGRQLRDGPSREAD